MIWFTADTHFNHANIMRYCKRPFATVDEMNKTILSNLNTLVKPDDMLYHLGDFSMGPMPYWRDQIACKNVVLIRGNHDKQISANCFTGIHNLFTLKVSYNGCPTGKIVLCHYAMRVWESSHYGSWHLYGHSHGMLPEDSHSLSFDVGIDCNDFKPLSIDQVAEKMSRKEFTPINRR